MHNEPSYSLSMTGRALNTNGNILLSLPSTLRRLTTLRDTDNL